MLEQDANVDSFLESGQIGVWISVLTVHRVLCEIVLRIGPIQYDTVLCRNGLTVQNRI